MWKFLNKILGIKEISKTFVVMEWTAEEVILIKNDISRLNDKIIKENEKNNILNRETANRTNSYCPKCNSKNVNDRIKRTQGDLNSSASSFGRLSSVSVSAKIDTNEVNKCNECEHEWKKAEAYFHSSFGVLDYWTDKVRYMLASYSEYKNCKFNPLDAKEQFLSIEEKEEALKKKYESKLENISEFWSGTNLITLHELMRRDEYDLVDFKKYYDEEVLILAGFIK